MKPAAPGRATRARRLERHVAPMVRLVAGILCESIPGVALADNGIIKPAPRTRLSLDDGVGRRPVTVQCRRGLP
jgi:hypothetical protein